MTIVFNPYPAMKASGTAWLGKVPAHWELRRTKTLLSQRTDKGFPEEPLLAATQTQGVVRKDEYATRTVLALQDLHLLKLVHAGDFVISLRSFQGGIEYARDRGIISPAYTVLYPLGPGHHAYLARLFKSRPYIENLSLAVTGIRQGQNIDYERLARSYLPLPPLSEQAAIVRFLDHVDQRIQRYIHARQKLIALLEEQQRAIIDEAVTGRIDVRTGQRYAAYKPTDVEGLKEVPEHWDVVALKRVLIALIDCEHKTAPAVAESEYYVVRTSAVRGGILVWEGTYCTDKSAYTEWTSRGVPRLGDVIFTREAPAGEACLVPEGRQVCLGQRTVLLRPDPTRYDPSFLIHMIYGGPPRVRVLLASQGSTVGHFNVDDIGWMSVLVPPLHEQKELAAVLGSYSAKAERARRCLESELRLFHEYRTRLLADVATGKLDVRQAAAGLPDEVKEPQLFGGTRALVESEEEVSDDLDAVLEEAEV